MQRENERLLKTVKTISIKNLKIREYELGNVGPTSGENKSS